MSIPVDFFVNLAASLAFELLKAGAARLRQAALGTPQQQALQRVYQAAFEAALRASVVGADQDQARRIAGHLLRFLDLPDVASTLLDMALTGSLVPDLDLLSERHASLVSDDSVPPIDVTRTLAVFHSRLTTALLDEASADKSPLYNQVSVDRILTIHGLLRGQQHSLREISRLLQRMETQATARTIIIEQATGVAIGDGATVSQFPDDVRLVLAEVLNAVRELNAQRRPLAYSQEDLRSYLQTVVEQCQTLDLRSAGGPVEKLPLERVYVALKADTCNAAERRANHEQFLADLAEHEEELATRSDLDERARWQIWRAVARGIDPMGLTLALRQRANAERGDYLALAATRIDLGQLIGQERWAVLLGDPGAGKTTLIRWLAMQFARSLLAGKERVQAHAEQVQADVHQKAANEWIDLGPARLPVPLRLADYAASRWGGDSDTALTLFQYLGRQPWLGRPLHIDPVVAQAIIQDALHQGRALVLLDGLDEITDQHRRGQVVDAIAHFLRTWVRDPISSLCAAEEGYAPWQGRAEERPQAQGGNQVLITSRPIGYYLAPLPSTLAHYTVEEMSEHAIGHFCWAWTAAVHEQTGLGDPAADARLLSKTVLDPNRHALREIASNPLLLTILAGLFYTLKGKLPERRIELYDQVVKAFTRQRHDAWRAQGLSDERFRYAMGHVAAQLHANSDPRFANGLAGEVDIKQWLRQALRDFDGKFVPAHREQADLLFASAADVGGFLLERGDGAYGFIHRTFQEYFVALFLTHDPNMVASSVCLHLDDPNWREPLLLSVAQSAKQYRGILPAIVKAILAAPEPAPGLLPRNALFIAACLPEIEHQLPGDLVAQSVSQLIVAYADRSWPVNETTRPSWALRETIERAVRLLHGQKGAQEAIITALLSEDPVQRLAAADLILVTDWVDSVLATPLLTAVRDYAEPTYALRAALWQQVRDKPYAFDNQVTPLRSLLADRTTANALAEQPLWRGILQALYIRPDWVKDQPLTADSVCFDSALSPWLIRAWQEGWTASQLVELLSELAEQSDFAALARDAAWTLAVIDHKRWQRLLVDLSSYEKIDCVIAGLLWNVRASYHDWVFDPSDTRTFNRAHSLVVDTFLEFDFFFDVNRVHSLTHALEQACYLDPDFDLWLNRDRAIALSTALIRNFGYARDLALSSGVLAGSDHFRNLSRALYVLQGDLDALERVIDYARDKLLEGRGMIDFGQSLAAAADCLVALRSPSPITTWRALASASVVLSSLARLDDNPDQRVVWTLEHLKEPIGLTPDLLARLEVPTSIEADDVLVRSKLKDQARNWLYLNSTSFRKIGALILAELGYISTTSLAYLLPLLIDVDDLLTQRARKALRQEWPASILGDEILLELARNASLASEIPFSETTTEDANRQIGVYCGWTLNRVIHDNPDWLKAWSENLEDSLFDPKDTLLGNIHRLDEPAWPVFIELLISARPRAQDALLQSTNWILRSGNVPDTHTWALADVLLKLAQTPDSLGATVVSTLGHFRNPPAHVVATLKRYATSSDVVLMENALGALARLAPDMEPGDQTVVDRLLADSPATPTVNAAKIRRLLNQQNYVPSASLVEQLATMWPDPDTRLRALIAAGVDDDVWSEEHHARITTTIRLLLGQHASLWPLLVEELRSGLQTCDWTRHRIVLAALASCAEAMPTQFNKSAANLERLILRASHDEGSHNSRRFAITALSYLRLITPEVLAALLRLAGDTEEVQQDALAAAARFNRLDPFLGQVLPAELTAALTGPSVLRARTAARLLQALGTSQAAQATPGLRYQIVQALAAALQDPGCRRPVWVSVDETDGTLDQDLYQALLRVAGF
ncbi:MAG: hypothetical protein WA040_21295 [Anaerolineae bacterium]